jgi:hypothetical protein
MEAQHRLVFERLHGHGKFTFEAKHPTDLKKRCTRRNVWNPKDGAYFQGVLEVIQSTKGVPTTKVPNDVFLPLTSFSIIHPDTPLCMYQGRRIQPLELAWIIYKDGPVLGGLLVDEEEYPLCDQHTNYVYKGALEKKLKDDKTLDGHAVICFKYRFLSSGDLDLRVMDNWDESGPVRWIEFTAFDEFARLEVEPINSELLRRRKKRYGKTDTCNPFKFLLDKLYYFR